MQSNKQYLGLLGGLGDIIYGYLHNPEWHLLADYVQKNPTVHTKAIIVSHNPSASEIVKLNPNIHEIVQYPPKREMRDLKWKHHEVIAQYANGFTSFRETNKASTKGSRPLIYMTATEKHWVNCITGGRTAVVHPFASDERRMVIPPEKYERIIDELLLKGFSVIALGGSYTKSFGSQEQYRMVENFTLNRDGFLNLIGQTNPRVSTAIVCKSDLFVGTWSCYGITAWIHGIKSVVAIPEDMVDGCSRIHRGKYRDHHKDDIIVPISDSNIKPLLRSI